MLNYSARRILREISKICKHQKPRYPDQSPSCTSMDIKFALPKVTLSEINDAITYLTQEKYISVHNNKIMLEYKGKHRRELAWLAFLSFMAKSIITPIIVSAITTFIGLLISGIVSI